LPIRFRIELKGTKSPVLTGGWPERGGNFHKRGCWMGGKKLRCYRKRPQKSEICNVSGGGGKRGGPLGEDKSKCSYFQLKFLRREAPLMGRKGKR